MFAAAAASRTPLSPQPRVLPPRAMQMSVEHADLSEYTVPLEAMPGSSDTRGPPRLGHMAVDSVTPGSGPAEFEVQRTRRDKSGFAVACPCWSCISCVPAAPVSMSQSTTQIRSHILGGAIGVSPPAPAHTVKDRLGRDRLQNCSFWGNWGWQHSNHHP